MLKIEKYDYLELRYPTNQELTGCFTLGEKVVTIRSFAIEKETQALRFMPEEVGVWDYHVLVNEKEHTGSFRCTPNTGDNHGKVTAQKHHFRYADGEEFIPLGTTIYAMIHQTPELIEETFETLASAPFNKARLCIFPKSMPFNQNEPLHFPFERNADGSWDLESVNFTYWDLLDSYILRLRKMGIEVDLILFHPYDEKRWGFDYLPLKDCLTYLDYAIRRLSPHRNLWWSLANEYDLMPGRKTEDWDIFGEYIKEHDRYQHLRSVHHCLVIYPKRDWMSHCSIQSGAVLRMSEWQKEYNLPVINDEFGYEGNIEYGWGNLSAFEFMHRAWSIVTCGGYVTHGETFLHPEDVLWWAKGGKLYGETPKRLAFLHEVQKEIGTCEVDSRHMFSNPNADKEGEEKLKNHEELKNQEEHQNQEEHKNQGDSGTEANPFVSNFIKVIQSLNDFERRNFQINFKPSIIKNDTYKLQYLGRQQIKQMNYSLPDVGEYQVEAIDIWEMTKTMILAMGNGNVVLNLPGKEGIALLVTKL